MEKNKIVDVLIKDLRAKKAEAKKFSNEGNTQAKQEAIAEIRDMENRLQDMLDIVDHVGNNADKHVNSFVNILKARLGLTQLSDVDMLIMDYMQEDFGADGGFLIPADIQVAVKELRRDGTDLESLINVEPVHRDKGGRTIEVRADDTPLELVLEGESIPEVDTEKLTDVNYEITKRAGIINVSNELFDDSNDVILKWLKTWLGKKSKATRNYAIVDKANEMTEGKEIAITTAEDVKTIFNKTLDGAYSDTAIVLTNASGYDYLDNLVDTAGEKVLESDIPNKRKLLFGLYPVKKVSDKLLKNEEVLNVDGVTVDAYRYPIICGDLKEAITLFDRESLSIDITQQSFFFTDQTRIKVRDRIDVEAVDSDAIIKAYVQVAI